MLIPSSGERPNFSPFFEKHPCSRPAFADMAQRYSRNRLRLQETLSIRRIEGKQQFKIFTIAQGMMRAANGHWQSGRRLDGSESPRHAKEHRSRFL